MIIKLTYHAKKRMVENAINIDMIKRAIKQGAIIRQTDGYKAGYGYYWVAFKKRDDIYKIKSVGIKK